MENSPQEKPPLFSRWAAWYWVVGGFLAALIVFFYLFTKHYS
ncbi:MULTISPECIES: hypothetical protein [Chitinophaga]|nr:hypothetical protein [Chitinophaga alhagiae]